MASSPPNVKSQRKRKEIHKSRSAEAPTKKSISDLVAEPASKSITGLVLEVFGNFGRRSAGRAVDHSSCIDKI
ncbi:hypothetical protein PoB_000900900 [Plakobranchus ocellatus]|uniref:Uncharacterized protein n=1 Tax=Plakobranchus ocellatus TaxID=259542 RepID=A0AAV3YJP1_9GAST|nr:hypothetical protein PoB_000900900 [Plakobranchus ocellatus]